MSGRCKACNVILNEDEMLQKWPGSEDFCDLCNHCLHLSEEDGDVDNSSEVCYNTNVNYDEEVV